MARVEAIPQKCIYVIEAGAHVYIGQTIRGTQRLDEHIRAAYYERSNEGIYKEMQHYRMQDLHISYYAAPNYGIANFDQAFTEFCAEGESVGTMTDIDFAEIFHIMQAVRNNKHIDNISMGGQSSGYHYIGPSAYHKGKTLMRTMTPEEAYGIFMLGGAQSSLLADATTALYNDMFNKDGPNIYKNNYQAIYPNASAKELQTFQDFIYTNIVSILATNITRIGKSNKVNPNSDVHKEVSKWLSTKQSLAEKILQHGFHDKNIKCPLKIDTQLDFSLLTDYLINVIQRWSGFLTGQSKNQEIATQISDFKPRRASVIWKGSSLKKPHTSGLTHHSVFAAQPINQDYLKYRSFLLFERVMRNTDRGDFEPKVLHTKEFNGEMITYFAAYNHEGEHTLSKKVHDNYLPCYEKNGWAFYKPMVAKGRKYHNRPEFQDFISENDTRYQGYPDGDIYILYKTDKIINSSDFMDGSEITIY